MYTKEQILNLIKLEAKNNNNKPVSEKVFQENTGVKSYYWQKYWPRFGDAQEEAGFKRNKFLKISQRDDVLFEKFVVLIRELNKWPTKGEMVVKHNNDKRFPSDTSFYKRYGNKIDVVQEILEYASKHNYSDIIKICQKEVRGTQNIKNNQTIKDDNLRVGWIYLFRSGKNYKIGKSYDPMRRNYEIGLKLPDENELIHKVKVDDIDGMEKYWHQRFKSKRKNGEWFNLSADDVKAMKRWTIIEK